MGARVAVAGASGYAGGELLRLLAGHPDLELAAVTADSKAGQPVGIVHPQLAGLPALAGRRFDATDPGLISGCDLAFLALPPGQSAPLASLLPETTKIVDLGADFRLADPAAWARYYGTPHPGRWVCGLPELPGARARIRAASRVAAPGCYATAAIVALAPLLGAGLVEPADVVIVAASGTSGAGRAAKAELLGSEVMGSVSAYQVAGAHRHTPEIEQALGEAIADARRLGGAAGGPGGAGGGAGRAGGAAGGLGGAGGGTPRVTISFTPLLAPMPRGILATCTARLSPGWRDELDAGAWAGAPAGGPGARHQRDQRDAAAAQDAITGLLRDALDAAYAAEPFACLLPAGRWPATASVGGSNAVHLQAAADVHAGRAIAVAAIDNLGKGAAGQAIQNANIMLGLPETAGLTTYGVAP
jgi:N-acetyl-gamma-glutamyl-phosphate reductase